MTNSGKLVKCVEKILRCEALIRKWRNMASRMQTGDVARFRLRQCADELEQAIREPDKDQ